MLEVSFVALQSAVDAAFWHRLAREKLEVRQLDDSPIPLYGSYSTLSTVMSLGPYALDSNFRPPPFQHVTPGVVVNTNTLEAFKTLDRDALFNAATQQVGNLRFFPSTLTAIFRYGRT